MFFEFLSRLSRAVRNFFSPQEELILVIPEYQLPQNIGIDMGRLRELLATPEIPLSIPEAQPNYLMMTFLEDQSRQTRRHRLANVVVQMDERFFRQRSTPDFYRHGTTRPYHQENPFQPFISQLIELPVNDNAKKLEHLPDLEIPSDYCCAIGMQIMTTPVYDPAKPQERYELNWIRIWLEENGTNPFTRQPLALESLIYDETLKEEINAFVSNALRTPRP